MFDCGPGATGKLVAQGLWPVDVSDLFFTHHHFDHNADYGCFLLCRWDQATDDPLGLSVWGPRLTTATTQRLIGPNGVFAPDITARINHELSQAVWVNRGGRLPRVPPSPRVSDIEPGPVTRNADFEVRSAVALHVQPYLDSLAYRVETPDGAVVFTGDTEPCESVVDLAKGARVMVSMCWDRQPLMDATGEARGQMGTQGAARMAAAASVEHLVLSHIGPNLSRSDEQDRGLDEVSALYSGRVTFATEGTQIDLSAH